MANKTVTASLSEPLNGATSAKVEIDTAAGNLTIDRLAGGEPMLATGTLEYFESQGVPTRSVSSHNGQVTLAIKGGGLGRAWFRLPWAACNGAFEWQVHLNPAVSSDITAHSGGGNVKLDLAGMAVSRVAADTGGGNMEVVLPDHAANLNVDARTGAGNVTVEMGGGITGRSVVDAGSGAGNVVVRVPSGIAARVHATSGLGKVMVDSRFCKLDGNIYQSPDYDRAADKVEINAHSGAGNVTVSVR